MRRQKGAIRGPQTLPGPHFGPTGRLLGYARVSTEDQATDAQTDELRAAGCAAITRSTARAHRGLGRNSPGYVRNPARRCPRRRPARSPRPFGEPPPRSHRTTGGWRRPFRSLRDPIDTSTPQGMFSLQVLGAVAQLERALISERTKAGIKAAQARGKLSGNPGLRARDPAAIAKAAQARNRVFTGDVIASMDRWLPTVRRMRPQSPWEDVVQVLNQAGGARWTTERLRRAVQRAVRERLADTTLLERAPRRPPEDRLMMMVAGIAMANPEMSLRAIGAQLEAMRERTPRGGRQWAASSVKNLLDQAEKLGLAPSIGNRAE